MRKYIFAALVMLAAHTLVACDDGRIEEKTIAYKEGRVVKMTGTLSGLDHWADGFNVSVAGFDGTDEYAVISRQFQAENEQGQVAVVLAGIPDQVTSVQLCVLDRLRRHVMTFSEIALEQTRDTVYMDVGEVDVSMLNAIQQGYLNTTCTNCHGASNRAAAGLYLTEGRTYGALVGVPSTKVEGMTLVEPGNAEQSLLHIILNQDKVEGISMSHHDLVSEKNEQSILPLIDSWIDSGAKEK